MSNHLINETSPYLLQHANNPVEWYPWGEEAWQRAREEDKPVFLSIGYSTCHWCHVMAHESFEDEQIAEILNLSFISIKVYKEERPDIDSIYMSVCQALTGSGGWPTTVFLTPEQNPFFAGTYFAPTARYGRIGFKELILTVEEKWKKDRTTLVDSANEIVQAIKARQEQMVGNGGQTEQPQESEEEVDEQEEIGLIEAAVRFFKSTYDEEYGGFGEAPKFPSPHNLLFLMRYFERNRDYGNHDADKAMEMVEKTLLQMYRGGIFDHIGGGFSRYSTDRYFLVPHFEKMLYDNARLILAYCKAYQLTANVLYRGVAEKTANYIMREMTSEEGGFYSAQDADSEGVEGKFYLFEPIEVMKVLGRKVGKEFCGYFDITSQGNFEGKSIPNLLNNNHISARYNELFCELYEYRKKRYYLHLDDKILTSWNGLTIAAMCSLYRVTKKKEYLAAAKNAQEFIEKNMCDNTPSYESGLHVSYRKGSVSGRGFLDDYANVIFALLALYGATLDKDYLGKADQYCKKAIADFWDEKRGGFFLSGQENESLFMRPKETYDGALPSGNSMMAYNLVWLYYLMEEGLEEKETYYKEMAEKQLSFMRDAASSYPAGYAMALLALMDYYQMPDKITVVLGEDVLKDITCGIPLGTIVRVLNEPTEGYPLKNHATTYYVCKGNTCYPPKNELELMVGKVLPK